MMKSLSTVFGICAGLCAFSLQAAVSKDFPSETKWMLSLDVQAAQAAPVVTFVADQIAPAKRQEAKNKLAAIKAMFGVDLIKDISKVILAGNGSAEKGGVAYVYGTFDVQRLSTILAGNRNYEQFDHNGVTVMSWNDNKQKFVAFPRTGLATISNSRAALTDALDVLAGKKPGLTADSGFKTVFASTGHDLLTVQAIDVSAIAGEQPKAQALKQAQTLSLHIGAPSPDSLDASLNVTAASDETAQQIQQALMGIQALALLRAGEDTESATLASLAKISGQGRSINVTLSLPQSVIEKVIRQREARQAAKAAARAAAAEARKAAAAPAAAN